ncbi:hypothetical protein C8F04DRAFT_1189323 [Mycena alexandri]|uniref:Uncharacterized protein n=1 Tax=Mycena alexandri TaxID=1745969 RepID=A0AAD6WUC8_9AGAR|nr:hypothetical protein C8F04DRAFT_1189323 [Mycena alexandri]
MAGNKKTLKDVPKNSPRKGYGKVDRSGHWRFEVIEARGRWDADTVEEAVHREVIETQFEAVEVPKRINELTAELDKKNSLAVEGVVVQVERNKRPKVPTTSHAKTNAAPRLRRPIPAQLEPVLPNSSASASSPFSSTLAAAVTAILRLLGSSSRAVSLSALPKNSQHVNGDNGYCGAPASVSLNIPLGLSPPFHLPPLHNLRLDAARGDSPYVCCARPHSKHADATQIAEGGNEHNESLIQQGTRGGDRSSRELGVYTRIPAHPPRRRVKALPARMGSVSPAGWVKTAYNVSAGVQEGDERSVPPSLLFYFASRPRLPPSLEPAFAFAPPSFLLSSPPSRAPPHTRAVESSADGTRFRLPVLRAGVLVCAPSPRGALQAIPSTHLPSSSPLSPHPSSSPALVYVYTPHCRVNARRHQLRSAQTRTRWGRSYACACRVHARRVPRAAPQVLLAYGRCARTRTRTCTALLGIAPSLSSLPTRTAPPLLLPPTHILPHLHPIPPSSAAHLLPQTRTQRSVRNARRQRRWSPPAREPAGVARAECARTGFTRTLRRLRTLHTAANSHPAASLLSRVRRSTDPSVPA